MPDRQPGLVRLLAASLVAMSLAACSAAGGTPGASSTASAGSSAPTASPSVAGIAHPLGRDEIVLRYDQAGGFVPAEFFAAHVPAFTLYGDGTVVFVSSATPVTQDPNGPSVGERVRTGKLSEERVQALLEYALRDGGLAVARTEYQNPNVADAPTTTFEIHAAGDSKTVSIMALGLDAQPGPDSAIKAAFVQLQQRLAGFDQGGTGASQPYAPQAYRGVLMDAAGVQGVKVRDWPWPSLMPVDFALPVDPNAIAQRTRVLTPDEAGVLGVKGFENGVTGGLYLRGPDGAVYSLVLRPLLPDEDR